MKHKTQKNKADRHKACPSIAEAHPSPQNLGFINRELDDLKHHGLYRKMKSFNPDGRTGLVPIRLFCSNDYLGLTTHPQIIAAAVKATKEYGAGAGSSRLVCGNLPLHEELEKKIARFKGRPAAVIFSTGYMANLGTISALVDEKDTVIIDRLNHASIVDAARLSRAKLQVYKHCNLGSLETILKRSAKYKKRLIVTDSIFSMEGSIAPLPQIVKLAKEYNALTMIDEAHATGTLGVRGQGIEEYFGMEGSVDVVLGTMSKALGGLGGFVAGSEELIDFLRNKARSFIYTTALAPANVAAAIAAIDLLEKDTSLIKKLQANAKLFNSVTPIIPVIIGDAEKTMLLSQKLLERGYFVSGIRPPTVPKGQSRLRISLNANHTKEEILCLASLLRELTPK